jgi:cytochrome c oxidase subunit 1/cytochrome c oxidase subunit I+III
VLLFIINVLKSRRTGAPAGANPWDAPTLEWSVPSPPPAYNFAVIPTVASRHPLWESRLGTRGARSSVDEGMLLDTGKETIGTSALKAHPNMVLEMPKDSFAPFLLALGTSMLFVGLLLRLGVLAGIGAAVAGLALLIWLWPRQELREREPAHG